MKFHVFTFTLTLLALLLTILASPIPPYSTSHGRTTQFLERQPIGLQERFNRYMQGVMDWYYIKTVVNNGKDIFLERELEGSIYISVHGLPPPAYDSNGEILSVVEQRRLIMEIAGIHDVPRQ
ncbi:hypothetical protein L218DRAFT_1079232 [Marasmius fiardii PR-910]|nr:hypothetical protein L218DRAFT_1079232 [Marasmius fiardii PR-910]